MATKKSKPRMLTFEDYNKMLGLDDFNKHHGTWFRSWIQYWGMAGIKGTNIKEEEEYAKYIAWYNRHFTKLGQALE